MISGKSHNIGMILDNEFNGDPRVENEVNTLQNQGHNVFVLCYNYGEKENEDFNGAKIVRFKISKFLKNKLRGLNNTVFNFYPKLWRNEIRKFIVDYSIDVLHVHDLWMMEAGILGNEKANLPIVLDLHENFISALQGYKYYQTFPGNMVISLDRWKRKEVEWMQAADKIIVVIEEAKDRIMQLGIPESRISVVANYVNIEDFVNDNSELTAAIIDQYKNNFTITYTGAFDLHRGLDVVIKSVPMLIDQIPNLKVVLVGGGSNENDLKKLAETLGVEEYVDFPGYQPHKDLASFVKASDVCIISHKKTDHTDNTIPHKLFQYMIMEKPVIASNCAPIERIIKETNAGLVYEHDSASALAKVVIDVFHSDRLEYGKNGKKAALEKYNWKSTSQNLINLYDKI